jgi:translation initiation factor IF-2
MAKLRIYELAKKRGLNPKKLLEDLQTHGYDVKATLSMVDENVVDAKGHIVQTVHPVKKKTKDAKAPEVHPKAEEPKEEPKEPETLKVTAQAPKAGQKAVFRVSKPLTKITQEELLPVPPPPPPPPPVEVKTEKPEEAVEADAPRKKTEPSMKVIKSAVEIEAETKEKDAARAAAEKPVSAVPGQEHHEHHPQIIHQAPKRTEEVRKVVLPKAPAREQTITHVQKHPHVEGAARTPQQARDKAEGSSSAQTPRLMPVPEKQPDKPAQSQPFPQPFQRTQDTKKKSKRDRRLGKLQAKQDRFERIEQETLKDQEMGEQGEAIFIREGVTVKELAEKINVKVKDIIQKYMMRGIFLTINQPLTPELAIQICAGFGFLAEIISFEDEIVMSQEAPREGEQEGRAPIVTVMGHVDHGKSSLLEAIHHIDITGHEHGGITQHIGAYKVKHKDREYVFLDTPGHEAFTMMRARGAKVTDIVILVVAADDGVMPQTVEAINHCKAANVPMIVAINKIDKPGSTPEKVKQDLMQHNIVTEEFGGTTVAVPISAKKKIGIDELLDMLSLTTDMMNLKAIPASQGTGTVLEAKLDKARGSVATVLIQDGTIKIGDIFLCGSTWGRIRQLYNDRAEKIDSAGPSTPVEVLGFLEVPAVGAVFQVIESEAQARQVSSFRREKEKQQALQRKRVTLETVFGAIKEGAIQELSIILKADVQGSIEALASQLAEISTDEVKVAIVHSGVGAVTESDVLLASASNAIVIGFNVRPDKKAVELAKDEGVDIQTFTIIYTLLEQIKQALTGMLKPIEREIILGHADVREVFKIGGFGTIAGCMVSDGKIPRSAKIRVLRDNVVIYESTLKSLKRFKDDASEVKEGLECGIGIENFNDIKAGDTLEAFETKIEARTL